jgi:hypothetical protein
MVNPHKRSLWLAKILVRSWWKKWGFTRKTIYLFKQLGVGIGELEKIWEVVIGTYRISSGLVPMPVRGCG